jgi:hypothetical protein
MGILRQTGCFRTKFRVCLNPVREIWVRWYVVPDCTPFFPYSSVFHEGVWENTHADYGQYDGIGPIGFFPRKWDPGLPPPSPSDFAGEPEWYVTGIPANLVPS